MFFFQQDRFSNWFLPCTVGPVCHQPCHQHRRSDRRSSMPRCLDWDVTESPDKLCEGSEWTTRNESKQKLRWPQRIHLRVVHSDAVCSAILRSCPGGKSERLFSGAWHLSIDVQGGRGLIFRSLGTFDAIGGCKIQIILVKQ